jgi:hypothetical protein
MQASCRALDGKVFRISDADSGFGIGVFIYSLIAL